MGAALFGARALWGRFGGGEPPAGVKPLSTAARQQAAKPSYLSLKGESKNMLRPQSVATRRLPAQANTPTLSINLITEIGFDT